MTRKIALEAVSFRYRAERRIFDRVTAGLDVSQGNVIGVVGPSGCGKSTLLKVILGVLSPQEGRVGLSFDRQRLAYVPQAPVFLEHLSAQENAKLLRRLAATRMHYSERAYKRLVDILRLGPVLQPGRSVGSLSGGELQRVSLLRALTVSPEVVLFDEPCTGMDSAVKIEFLAVLRDVLAADGISALYVTHHIDELRLVADDVALLRDGAEGSGVRAIEQDDLQGYLECPPTLHGALSVGFPGISVVPIQAWVGSTRRFLAEKGVTAVVVPASGVRPTEGVGGWSYRLGALCGAFQELFIGDKGHRVLAEGGSLREQDGGRMVEVVGRVLTYDGQGGLVGAGVLKDGAVAEWRERERPALGGSLERC